MFQPQWYSNLNPENKGYNIIKERTLDPSKIKDTYTYKQFIFGVTFIVINIQIYSLFYITNDFDFTEDDCFDKDDTHKTDINSIIITNNDNTNEYHESYLSENSDSSEIYEPTNNDSHNTFI